MRPVKALLAGLLALLLLSSCGDDDTSIDTGSTDSAEPGSDGQADAPDLTGTITSVTSFVPVTEDCTPAEDLDPNGSVSSDDPPICTPADNDVVGTILVEEDPADPQTGRKISYTVTTDTSFEGVDGFDDLAEGQVADTWVAGDMCAESYPEQCGLEALKAH